MSELILPYLLTLPPFFFVGHKDSSFKDLLKEISKSWLFFWSYYVLIAIIFLIFLPSSLGFNPLIVFLITLILFLFIKKNYLVFTRNTFSKQFLIFIIFFILSITNKELQIGGDAVWSVVLSLDFMSNNIDEIKYIMLGHRPAALPLINALSIGSFNQIFFAFNIFTILLFLTRFVQIFYVLIGKIIDSKIVKVISLAIFLTSPVLLVLSFYWGNHVFIALGFLELILFFNDESEDYKDFNYYVLLSSLIFFRLEVLFFVTLFYMYFYKKINKRYSLLTYTLPILWFANLYFSKIPLQKSDNIQFLYMALIMFFFLLFYNYVTIEIFYKKSFAVFILLLIHLLLIYNFNLIYWEIFIRNLLGLGGWGIIGTLILGSLIYLSLNLKKRISFTFIALLIFQILPYLNSQSGDGWRYGFSSSFNRILFYLLPIILYEFLTEITNED